MTDHIHFCFGGRFQKKFVRLTVFTRGLKLNFVGLRVFTKTFMDLSDFLIKTCPETAIYVPNYITVEEEERILSQVGRTPKPKWTQLLNRRLINYGGIPHPNGMISEEIPSWLQIFVDKINSLNVFETKKANHVLINEYLPGQGIMPHTDGPLFYPVISTISCGSYTLLEFSKKDEVQKIVCQFLIKPRSLLILKDDLYNNHLHSIGERKEDKLTDRICNFEFCDNNLGDTLQRGKRVSLTIRNVPKTTKLKLKF